MIIVVGLTPAWQQILTFAKLVPGEVNRASTATWCASGKIINVVRAAQLVSTPTTNTCLGLTVLGGSSGQAIRAATTSEGLRLIAVETAASTRICTTLLDQSQCITTELVENAQPLLPSELQRFEELLRQQISAATTLVLTGSLPQGLPPEYYLTLLNQSVRRTILDLQGPGLLQSLQVKPTVVKPNRTELAHTLQRDISQPAEVWQAASELQHRGAQHVVISDGAEPGYLLTAAGERLRFHPPRLSHVVNPIGSGDSLTAGIAWGLDQGQDIVQAVRWGVAMAAANAEELLPATWQPARLQALLPQVLCVSESATA